MTQLKNMLNKLKDWAKSLKKEVSALYLACKRADVPWYAKLIALLVVGYALSPIDLIPDFVPVLGYLDDLVLIPLGITLAVKMIPPEVISECRQQAVDMFKNGKPKNWIAGTAIILLWVTVIGTIFLKVFLKGFAVPAEFYSYSLLFIGSFIAASISGAAGFGGALLLLPLLSITVGTALAVPILTIAQLTGNLSRVFFGIRQIRWKPALVFIAGAVPMSVLGAFSFIAVPKDIITRAIGLFIILFAVFKYFKLLKFQPSNWTMLIGGGTAGLLSGLVGSAGPIGAALFLSLNLSSISYIASEAVTAVVMHISKTIVYQRYLGIGIKELGIGLFMGAAMIIGTWAGKKVIVKMPEEKFVKFVGVMLCLVGIQMLIWGAW